MILPRSAFFVLVVLLGFLTSSTFYFYNKSRSVLKTKNQGTATFQADLPQLTGSAQSQKVDQLTKPAESRGRLSFPVNTYTVASNDTLFGIAAKFDINWQLLKKANGVVNEDLVQTGNVLVIPRLEPTSDSYRINFDLNEDRASELNRDLRDKNENPLYSPIEVAKKDAVPYFNIATDNEFTLLEQDDGRGSALVQAKNADSTNVVGLFQPKTKGKKGFWAVLYVETRQ
ncbi:MAG: LysM peptidoglycan-binding domain-containing protein [Patescibacteria group bacterium]